MFGHGVKKLTAQQNHAEPVPSKREKALYTKLLKRVINLAFWQVMDP